MIDLRKTYCNLDSEHIDEYKDLIREQGINSIAGHHVDEMIFMSDYLGIDEHNKSHCDNLKYCLESSYTEFKGNQDNPNKHPHHDLIIEWAKDTSKIVQRKNSNGVFTDDLYPEWLHDEEYRFKPQREFIKGHWYPCLNPHGNHEVLLFDGEYFNASHGCRGCSYNKSDLNWIGESLGEIEFGYFDNEA